MTAPNFHLHFKSQHYDLDLIPSEEKFPVSVFIEGHYYQIIGERFKTTKLRELIPTLQEGISSSQLKQKLTIDETPTLTSIFQMEAMDRYLTFMEKEKYFREDFIALFSLQ